MNEPHAFFLGFVVAGVLGFFGTLYNKSRHAMNKTVKDVFVNCPKPSLEKDSGSTHKVIGTTPSHSALQEVFGGCFAIVGQLIWQLSLLVFLGALVYWFWPQLDFTPELFSGIIFAAVYAFLIGQIRSNWKKILDIRKRIMNPPSPSLKFVKPTNSHYLAANPALPAFTNVVTGFVEMSWRVIWELVLLFLLLEAISGAYFYVSEGVIRFSDMGIFGI